MIPDYRVQPTDPDILQEAAEGLCKHFHIKPDEADRKDAIGVLVEALEEISNGDGYQLAKLLDDRYGWDIEEGDVEALSSAHAQLRSLARKKTIQKIGELGVIPRFAIGDEVSWTRCKKTRTGKIHSIIPSEMVYHIPITENGKPIRYVINDEDLSPCPKT